MPFDFGDIVLVPIPLERSLNLLYAERPSGRAAKVIENEAEFANLVIGPFDSGETLRQASLQLLRRDDVWWVRY